MYSWSCTDWSRIRPLIRVVLQERNLLRAHSVQHVIAYVLLYDFATRTRLCSLTPPFLNTAGNRAKQRQPIITACLSHGIWPKAMVIQPMYGK